MFLSIVLLSLVTRLVFSANILIISPVESVSHHIWFEVLIKRLLENDHNITLMEHDVTKTNPENYTVYKLTGFQKLVDDLELADQQYAGIFTRLKIIWDMVRITCEIHLKSDALKLMLDYPRDKFDLIIFDVGCGYEFYPLIEHFGNPPIVAAAPFGLSPYILDTMGSHFYFYYPYYNIGYTGDMTFFQRSCNTLLYISEYFSKWYHMPSIYKISQERYGNDITPFDQMERKIGLLLANYDPIFDIAQPLSPNIIPVGGLHVKRSEKLPNELQEILDRANSGIIYFSFGTIVTPGWLSVETKKAFMNVFSKLNQTVLWKYAADDLKNVPKNVIIRKWYPQNDILGHKNTKLFITHGGILSCHETMYHAVPVLGIPFFIDQHANTAKMAGRKLGKKLYINDLTEDILHESISEVINNPLYKQNMQKISGIFQNQKESPLERAIFWIEYALRNKDLSHLSIKARDMTLLQRENLDVYGVILLFVLIVLLLFITMMKYIVYTLIFKTKRKIKQN